MEKWISADDSLPYEGFDVLVCIDTGPGELDWRLAVMRRYQHCWRGVGEEFRDDGTGARLPAWGRYQETEGERVTHWREVVDLPGGKGFA